MRFGHKCNKGSDIGTNLKGTCHSKMMSSSVSIALVLLFYESSNALNALNRLITKLLYKLGAALN